MSRKFPWKISRKTGAIDFNRTTEYYDKTARIAHSSEKHSRRAKKQAQRQALEWSKGGTVLTSATKGGRRISISKKDAQAASEAWWFLAN